MKKITFPLIIFVALTVVLISIVWLYVSVLSPFYSINKPDVKEHELNIGKPTVKKNQYADSPRITMPKDTTKYTLDWISLSDTESYSITFIPLNFHVQGWVGRDIFYFQDTAKKMTLTNRQELQLYKFITNKSNFSGGECGTFGLNAGFLIFKADTLIGKINVGCGFNQWEFSPENKRSKYGGLSENGFTVMEKLLDDIYKSN